MVIGSPQNSWLQGVVFSVAAKEGGGSIDRLRIISLQGVHLP